MGIRVIVGRSDQAEADFLFVLKPGSIMPEGEDVELDFQAVDDKEVPYFDFATLHEVGHAVESQGATLMMQAGWKTHTSDEVAEKAAKHFKYDVDCEGDIVQPGSTPPPDVTTVPSPSNSSD